MTGYAKAAAAITMLAGAAAAQVVDLGYAKYQGFVDPTTHNTHFLGVRYAAAPTGPLRWSAPQTPQDAVGIQQANTQPPICFQGSPGRADKSPFPNKNIPFQPGQGSVDKSSFHVKSRAGVSTTESEDCLFLNVFTPGNLSENTQNLPVVVWIHGGGYTSGSASLALPGTDAMYDGDDLIREANGGVVAVIIQYRLAVFGFLPGTKVKQGGTLNAGLLDQDFALHWIHKFNGDPSRVTIWGQSAGGGSAMLHAIANGGNTQPPLFRGAISSSSYVPSQYHYNDVIPEQLYSQVVSFTNCSVPDSLSCLRAVDAEIIEAANVQIGNSSFFGTGAFVPVVDGTFIRQRPTEAFKQGKLNGEVVMAVTNAFEGNTFVDPSIAATVQIPDFVAQLFPLLDSDQIADATAQYKDLGAPIDQAAAIAGETILICPTYSFLKAFGAKAFKGEYAVPPRTTPMMFSIISRSTPRFTNPDFGKAFSESFLNFVLSLTPDIKYDPTTITPKWNTWEGSTEMVFTRTEAGAPDIRAIKTSNALLERCSFWESVADATGH
ncbi:Alpha/Beta hydrolase protein [Infundibulicybe gibba]|nr:Alpha/Beta hydrolase protein [Infundibulicybe gibba]